MGRQEASAPARRAPLGRALGLCHHHKCGQFVAFGPEAVGDPAPQTGETHDHAPGIHLVHRRGMDHAVGITRPDLRDVISVWVEMRDQVGHIHPRLAVPAPLAVAAQAERVGLEELAVDLAEARGQGLRVEPVQERLGVEEIHLAGAAGHEQEDAALGLRREMPGPGGERAGRFAGTAFTREQISQTEQSEAAAGRFQEFAPAARQERLRAGAAIGAELRHGTVP